MQKQLGSSDGSMEQISEKQAPERQAFEKSAAEKQISEKQKTVCLLVDGDNISPQYAERIVQEARSRGRLVIGRVYGDFSSSRLSNWKACALNFGLEPIMVASPVSGKNATDLALAIDAVELGLTGAATIFMVASGDSDFMVIASRLRRFGSEVHALGHSNAPQAYRQTCDSFIELDNGKAAAAQLAAGLSLVTARKSSTDVCFLRNALDGAYDSCQKKEGWVLLSALGYALQKVTGGLDLRQSGFEKLIEMVETIGGFEIGHAAGDSTVAKVRRGSVAQATAAA